MIEMVDMHEKFSGMAEVLSTYLEMVFWGFTCVLDMLKMLSNFLEHISDHWSATQSGESRSTYFAAIFDFDGTCRFDKIT